MNAATTFNGYIGSHLAYHLFHEGIFDLVDKSKSPSEWSKLEAEITPYQKKLIEFSVRFGIFSRSETGLEFTPFGSSLKENAGFFVWMEMADDMSNKRIFNLIDVDVKHRLHLNENHVNNLGKYWLALAEEFTQASFYPDPASTKLRKELAQRYKLSPNSFLVSNGTDEIILFLALTHLVRGGNCLSTASTFPGWIRASVASESDVEFLYYLNGL